jgi:hypothetical protein
VRQEDQEESTQDKVSRLLPRHRDLPFENAATLQAIRKRGQRREKGPAVCPPPAKKGTLKP